MKGKVFALDLVIKFSEKGKWKVFLQSQDLEDLLEISEL